MSGHSPHSDERTSPAFTTAGALAVATALLLAGCAAPPLTEAPPALPRGASSKAMRASVVDTARSMLGTRYRYGGSAPNEGFDCSGLVVYSYRRAGMRGLPRSAGELERQATQVSLDTLRPGDLLFFRLSGAKTDHVAIYEGRRRFIHAPSGGKRVERVGFDHIYWGPRITRAGRLLP